MTFWIRYILLLLLEFLGALLAAVLVVAALLAWRLSSGPLRLEVIEPYLVDEVSALAAPYRISFGHTALIWGEDKTSLGFEATQVRILTPEGVPVAVVPQIDIGFSMPGLLMGHIAPTYISLTGPQLHALRTVDGDIRMRLADTGTATAAPSADLLGNMIAALSQTPEASSPFGAIRRFHIRGARLEVDDFRLGVRWVAPRFDVLLRRNGEGMRGKLTASLDLGGKTSEVRSDLVYDRAAGALRLDAALDRFNPADLARWTPAFRELKGLDIPFSGKVSVRWVNPTGVAQIAFDLLAGEGTMALVDGQPAAQISRAQLTGALDRQKRQLDISTLYLGLGPASFKASAHAVREGNAVSAQAQASADGVQAEVLDRYWPAMVAKGARSWVTKNITAGQVNDLRAHLALTVPLADVHATQVRELVGSMRIDEATVHYFRPLPPATSARGLATFSDDVFSIHVERAKVGDLRLANAKVDLLGLASGAERADISLTVNGRVADQLTLLDHEPLRYMQRMHIDGGKAGGMATTRARFMFPLFNDLPIEDVAIAASSRLEDVSLPAVVMKQDLTKARLDLVLDGGGMKISGRGQVGPAEAELSWQESFVDDVRPGSEISFSGQMDEAARQAFHLSWPEVVSGNVGVKGTYSKERGQNAKLVAELDFAKAVLAMPWFAWSKPAGTAASGSVSATIGRDEVKSVDSFSVSGGGAVVKGSVSFAAGSRWEQVQLDKVSAPGTALSGRVGRLAGDQTGYKLDFSGANADIRGIYEKDEPTDGVSAAESGPEADRSLLPLDIRFNIAHVVTGEGRELNKAIGHISRTTRGWSHLELDGLLEGNEPLKIRLVPDNGGRLLAIETKNAGAMLSTLQLMDNIRGGTLSVTGRGEGAGPVEATADMRGFTYLQPETLRKLAAQASPEGAEVLQKSEGIVFSRMKARFIYDEASLRVEESRMASDVMGLTMSGKVDLLGSRLDLQGTLVPLYGINSAVGGIPVLGWLLTGGEGGGIFAATYSVKGPLAAPQTSVNPLAMLAPGFLRNILFLGSD